MSRKQRIHDALFIELKPDSLIIENESSRHQVPPDSETHFKIIAVSTVFTNLRPIARHRLINTLLASEFTSGLHALSLHLYTPDEWEQKTGGAPKSPLCHSRNK